MAGKSLRNNMSTPVNEIEKEIVELLTGCGTTPAVFDKSIPEARAIYKLNKRIYCLDEEYDYPFADVAPKAQEAIRDIIKSKKFKLDRTFQ